MHGDPVVAAAVGPIVHYAREVWLTASGCSRSALPLTMLTDAWRCALEDLAKGVKTSGRCDSTCNVGQLWRHVRGPIAAAVLSLVRLQ